MKRSLAGSSLCILLLSGYAAPNAGVAIGAAPAFAAAQATPVSSPPNSTIQAANSTLAEPVILAGLTPTQFVPYAAAKIRGAQTEAELVHFERYFLNYHSQLSEFLANSNPSTAVERDRYQVATQVMALMRELAAACKYHRELNGVAAPGYDFGKAQAIANAIERATS